MQSPSQQNRLIIDQHSKTNYNRSLDENSATAKAEYNACILKDNRTNQNVRAGHNINTNQSSRAGYNINTNQNRTAEQATTSRQTKTAEQATTVENTRPSN